MTWATDTPSGSFLRPAADARRRLPRHCALFALALLCALWLPPDTQAGRDSAELKALRSRLATLQKELDATREERDQSRAALRDVEREIGEQHRRLKDLERQQRTLNTRLSELKAKQANERAAIRGQRDELGRTARAAYVLGRQEYLKLMLNQQDPAGVSRALTYYRYLQEARLTRVRAAHDALEQLVQLESQIDERARALEALRTRERDEARTLAAARARRAALLAKVETRLSSQTQELERLRRDEQALAAVVKKVRSYVADIPPVPPTGLNGRFPENRGKMPLPLRGEISARYGSPKNLGDLRWRGLFLAAPEGREVQSVFRGRVAYADWLRGFGLLLILDHGDGYMTLYGHNQTLYKEAGDWVEAGQVIASTGSTGGPPRPGLYFEVRHNGEPRDPLQWCRAR